MSRAIITETGRTEEGEMLYCVHFSSSWYDNDARMPGVMPVNGHYFVLAANSREAIEKAQGAIAKDRARCDKDAKETIRAVIVNIEELVPTRDRSLEGPVGYGAIKHDPVTLTCPEDSRRYRLAVCLIPVEEG